MPPVLNPIHMQNWASDYSGFDVFIVKGEISTNIVCSRDDYSKALYYVAKRETELRVFFGDAGVQIDTKSYGSRFTRDTYGQKMAL